MKKSPPSKAKPAKAQTRRPRLLRARPLLVGVGAALLFTAAGCGDDGSTGLPATVDMGISIHDMAVPRDLTPSRD